MRDKATVLVLVILVGLLAFVLVGGNIALTLADRNVPESYNQLTALVVGGVLGLLGSLRSTPPSEPPGA